jgi:hypothetical protein
MKQIFPATTAEMAMEVALAKKLEEASKSPTIMKRVSPTDEELQKKVRDLNARGAIIESGVPVKPQFIQPNPKLSQNPAGYSRQQWEKNQNYKHTINQLHQFSQPEIISPESVEGHPAIINPGDRTAGGIEIVDVNGSPLTSPSKQEAGASFGHEMEDNGTNEWWASLDHAAEAVQEKARHAYDETGVLPLAIYTAMGAETGNFSMHNTDVALKMLYNKNPSLTQMHTFNKMMETGFLKGYNKRTGEEIWVRFPNFAGLENPEELREQLQKNPDLRKFFINRLEKEKTVSNPLDLPSGMAIRHAITENDLRDVPNGLTGYALGALHPESDIQTNINHNTYNRSINGNFLGRMQLQLPWEEYFPETHKKIMETEGQKESPFGTIQKLKTYETFTPELVDKLMRMYEIFKNKKFKKGGSVTNEQETDKPSLDDMKYELTKKADGGSVESDQSLPLQAHSRRFTTPDYLDVQDLGVTARTGDNAFTLGRQIMSKNEQEENPNMRYRQSMDYGQYSTPLHEGHLNARVMKDPQKPDLQAMLQYLQSVGKGTAGLGLMGNRTSEGDKLRALTMMYNQQIDPTSEISGMATLPFGQSPMFNVQYKKRFAEGGEVKKVHPALEKLIEEYVTNKKPDIAKQTVNERLGRETLKQPFPEHRITNTKPTVGLGAGLNLEGNKTIPSSQMELFKRKGGKVNKYAGGGNVGKLFSNIIKTEPFKSVKVGDTVSGMVVRPNIPDKASIPASLYEYSTHGVQEVPMSAFTVKGKPKYYSKERENYTKDLARQIQENKELNPLIVVKDKEGHYILEGSHRFDALRELGIESFPALMVHDLESLGNEEANPELNKKNGGKISIDDMKYALTRKK